MHSASNNELVAIKLMVNPHRTIKESFKFEIQIVRLKKKCEQPKKWEHTNTNMIKKTTKKLATTPLLLKVNYNFTINLKFVYKILALVIQPWNSLFLVWFFYCSFFTCHWALKNISFLFGFNCWFFICHSILLVWVLFLKL